MLSSSAGSCSALEQKQIHSHTLIYTIFIRKRYFMLSLLSRCATHILFSTSKTPPHHTATIIKLKLKCQKPVSKSGFQPKNRSIFCFYAKESLDFEFTYCMARSVTHYSTILGHERGSSKFVVILCSYGFGFMDLRECVERKTSQFYCFRRLNLCGKKKKKTL